MQGAVAPLQVYCQRRRLQLVVISGLISQTYLHQFCFSWWDVANPRTTKPSFKQFILHLTLRLIIHAWFNCIRTFLSFSPKPCRRQYFDFLTYFAEIMSPMNFGLFWEAIAETLLLFWIFNMLVKTLWTLVKTPFDNIGCPTSFSRSTSCGSFINLTI